MPKDVLDSQRLAPELRGLLARLRRRIRLYIWLEGAAAALAIASFSFWASLGLDWFFEPPAPLRVAVLAAVGLVLSAALFRLILRRAFVRLADRSMALAVERRFPQFEESLVTAVELDEQPKVAEKFSAAMIAHTRDQALAAARGVELSRVVNRQPLLRVATLATMLLVSVAIFGGLASQAFGIWARRSLMLSEELWPRKTHLTAEGFARGSKVKVARGADYTLIVGADARPGRVVPETVELRYTLPDRASTRDWMVRQGVAVPGEDSYQQFTYTFKSVLDSLEVYARGGDDRIGPLLLEVVESPTISSMALTCKFPAYMRRAKRQIPVTGTVQVPRGTQLTLAARTNKPIVRVEIEELGQRDKPLRRHAIVPDASGGRRFTFSLPALIADQVLLFTLLDVDGIRNRDPIRLTLAAKADEPPQVNVQLVGIGTAITPSAALPVEGRLLDDYGIDRAWFAYEIDSSRKGQLPLRRGTAGGNEWRVRESLETEPLKLVPKQKLQFAVQAADAFALGKAGPNVAAGQSFMLDVVTPHELRRMLEARELVLRRRFETIIAEFTETRDALAKIELRDTAAGSKPGSETVAKTNTASPGSNAGPAARADEGLSAAEQALMRRRVQTQRVSQNSERARHETAAVTTAFRDIRQELVNNRLDTEELKTRLEEGIATPLEKIANEQFPRFKQQLDQLESALDQADKAAVAQTAAIREADLILVQMRQVLAKILELETFHQVLDMLRAVIDAHQEVTERTKERQRAERESLEE